MSRIGRIECDTQQLFHPKTNRQDGARRPTDWEALSVPEKRCCRIASWDDRGCGDGTFREYTLQAAGLESLLAAEAPSSGI
jgi:hypothetical protein